jgi:carbonic anhydrase
MDHTHAPLDGPARPGPDLRGPDRPRLGRRGLLLAGGLATLAAGSGAATPASAGAAAPAPASEPDPHPVRPREALDRLLAGNRRFVAGRARHPRQSPRHVRDLAGGQQPFAVVLGCADSRVPAELIFDQGLGDLFDNRIAGNLVDDLLLGSIEYAVEHLGPVLVVVLGHERCGAITATVEAVRTGETPHGHVGTLVEALRPVVEAALRLPGDPVENGVLANVRAQAHAIVARSGVVREAVRAGRLAVVGARHDLDTGRVTMPV